MIKELFFNISILDNNLILNIQTKNIKIILDTVDLNFLFKKK